MFEKVSRSGYSRCWCKRTLPSKRLMISFIKGTCSVGKRISSSSVAPIQTIEPPPAELDGDANKLSVTGVGVFELK